MKKDIEPPAVPVQPEPLAYAPNAAGLAAPVSWRGIRRLWRRPVRKPRGSFARPAGRILTIEVEDESLRDWPTVRITSQAHGKMRALIEACPLEVSWLATCVREGDDVVIDDIFIPEQVSSFGTFSVTKDGEANLLAELLSERRYDSVKRLNCWGHSHVTGDVFASGTDEDHTQEFIIRAKDMRKDFFVRLIANKWDDLFATVYLFDQGLAFHNVPISADPPETGRWRAWARREVKLKVRKLRFVPVKRQSLPLPQTYVAANAPSVTVQFGIPLQSAGVPDTTGKKEGES